MTGDEEVTRLIVIRGNSASGKSTIAAEMRREYGRGLAVVSQDNLRRVVLRDHDRPGAANIGLIAMTVRYALSHGFHAVLEGILYSGHYGQMLGTLYEDYRDSASFWFLDVPFELTVERHSRKPQAAEYGRAVLQQWWHGRDELPGIPERVITAGMTPRDAAALIIGHAGLAGRAGETSQEEKERET